MLLVTGFYLSYNILVVALMPFLASRFKSLSVHLRINTKARVVSIAGASGARKPYIPRYICRYEVLGR